MTKRAAKTVRNDTPKSFRFTDSELDMLGQAAKKAGSAKKAVMLGLNAYLIGSPVTKTAVLKYIEANLK